jgi:hypothetical protein
MQLDGAGYVSKWNDKSTHVVSVSQHYKDQIKCAGLVQSGYHHHFIISSDLKINISIVRKNKNE